MYKCQNLSYLVNRKLRILSFEGICQNLSYVVNKKLKIFIFEDTRPKPVGHGYVFSMTFGTIGEWLKLVPFFEEEQLIQRGGGGVASSFSGPKHP